MKYLQHGAAAAAILATFAAFPALAADVPYEPPVIIEPEPLPVKKVAVGGWYIRGDFNYHWSKLRGTSYVTYGPPPGSSGFVTTELDAAWSVGGGVGYNINSYLRADLTLDYFAKADFRGTTVGVCGGVPCTSNDVSAYSAWVVLANAYVDLVTYHGITAYVGAGIGGAYVHWDALRNTIGGVTTVHAGARRFRFAAALMAGASYCLTDNLELDLGYRYMHIARGRMFEYAPTVGPGFDTGINVHEARAGLRWSLGGAETHTRCAPKVVHYEPEPPIYK